MRFVFASLCLLITISLYGRNYPHGEHLTDKIFNQVVSKELKPKFHYGVSGYGGSSSRDYVRLIFADFDYQRHMNQDEIFDVLIETTETILRAYNSNKRIRPLLIEYPLTIENIKVIITGLDANAEHPDSVSWASTITKPPFKIACTYWDPVKRRIDRDTPPEERLPYAEVKTRREAARGKPFLVD